jgi:hypothetical protein
VLPEGDYRDDVKLATVADNALTHGRRLECWGAGGADDSWRVSLS